MTLIDITIAVIVWAVYFMTAPAIHRWAGRPTKSNKSPKPAMPDTDQLTCQHRLVDLCEVDDNRWLVCRSCGGVFPTKKGKVNEAA